MFRNSAQGEKRYEADKYYVENVSFGMDVSIIIGTIKRVLKRSDLYNDGNSEQTKES
jgi:undecaprenyl phosphate N,N'-diacetylbacillosamine 1-phosphate transferase